LKRLLFAAMFLASVMIVSLPAMAQVNIDVGPLATSEYLEVPPVTSDYIEAPDVIPLPETDNVYVVPDLDIDVFFLEWLVVASLARWLVSLTVL